MDKTDPRYPIGRFEEMVPLTPTRREECIVEIERLPTLLAARLRGVEGGLDATYRPGGWSVRQIVHHVADSHINAYVRFRLGLTEDAPTIKPYDEARWAALPDIESVAPDVSIRLIEALHLRWVALMRVLNEDNFAREIVHPEYNGRIRLDELVARYAWHGRHHLAHIDAALADRA